MASEPSHVGGVKRPAAATLDDAAAFSTEDGPIAIAGQQRQQRPRLADPDTREDGVDDTTLLHVAPLVLFSSREQEESENQDKDDDDDDENNTYVGNVGDISIICRIACFMNTGQFLKNVCISVGPADAAIIRNEYLLKNDAYLVKWLRRLHAIMGNAAEMGQGDWLHFKDNLHVFDKCRDCVVAWMVVNKDWKKRCTSAKIEAYKRTQLPFEADVIFNNPAVAIEIGSVDVVKFLIEEKGIDVNTSLWAGFNSGGFHMNSPVMEWPIEVALVRGDADILKQILYADGFDLTRFMHEDGHSRDLLANMIEFSTWSCVDIVCFRCLISHPSVDLNHYSYGRSPLGWILTRYALEDDSLEDDSEERRVKLLRLRMLLEEGANPSLPMVTDGVHTFKDFAFERYERASSGRKARWKEVLQVLGFN